MMSTCTPTCCTWRVQCGVTNEEKSKHVITNWMQWYRQISLQVFSLYIVHENRVLCATQRGIRGGGALGCVTLNQDHLQPSFHLYEGQRSVISQGSVGLGKEPPEPERGLAGLMGAQSTQVYSPLWRDKHKSSSIIINNRLQDVLHARSVLLHLK